MDIHVVLVRNEASSNCPLSFLFAQEADKRGLGVGNRNVFHAAYKRLLRAIIVRLKAALFWDQQFRVSWTILDGLGFLALTQENIHCLRKELLEPFKELLLYFHHSLELGLNICLNQWLLILLRIFIGWVRALETEFFILLNAVDKPINKLFLFLLSAVKGFPYLIWLDEQLLLSKPIDISFIETIVNTPFVRK